jgi:hypothetical protein
MHLGWIDIKMECQIRIVIETMTIHESVINKNSTVLLTFFGSYLPHIYLEREYKVQNYYKITEIKTIKSALHTYGQDRHSDPWVT